MRRGRRALDHQCLLPVDKVMDYGRPGERLRWEERNQPQKRFIPDLRPRVCAVSAPGAGLSARETRRY